MSRPLQQHISKVDLDRLRQYRIWPNLMKIPLFIILMVALTVVAWDATSWPLRWSAYIGIGYLWMSMVTLMHDATHNTLFRRPALNWVFGVLCMVPIFATFIAFRLDHVEHHRYNRTYRDPDAFTMGRRRAQDFILFYSYALIGGALSFLHFNFIYPFTKFNARQWGLQLFELALKAIVYSLVLTLAARHGVLGKTLAVWLWPVLVLSLLNSMRFVAEHYGTPWDSGQMVGTRTVTSNSVHSFFWNNINWHIGHHVYPSVPWYNLQELHRILESQIVATGAVVDRSYLAVYWQALRSGPESEPRLAASLAARRTRAARAASPAAASIGAPGARLNSGS